MEGFGYPKVFLCRVPAALVAISGVAAVILRVRSLFRNNFRVSSRYFLQISCEIYFALWCEVVSHSACLWQKGR